MRKLFWWFSGTLVLLLLAGGWWLSQPRSPRAVSGKADEVVVIKSKREMAFFRKRQCLLRCRIALGDNPLGHKGREGDEKTPEGQYTLDWRNNRSTCYRSIHISYPNQADQERARQQGVSPGGSIMIHGLPNGWGWIGRLHTWKDWTNGCIGVSNQEMDQIWALVDNGTPIEIRE
jgi:murein L,D-transpeptidase YafK